MFAVYFAQTANTSSVVLEFPHWGKMDTRSIVLISLGVREMSGLGLYNKDCFLLMCCYHSQNFIIASVLTETD